eukprot:615981-Hanusia_phi.AAC.1
MMPDSAYGRGPAGARRRPGRGTRDCGIRRAAAPGRIVHPAAAPGATLPRDRGMPFMISAYSSQGVGYRSSLYESESGPPREARLMCGIGSRRGPIRSGIVISPG